MVIDMTPMLRGEVKVIDFDYMLIPEDVSGVTFTDNAHVVGRITDDGGYMQLKASAKIPYETQCARCLDKVSGVFSVDFDRLVAAEGTLSEEQILENVDKYVVISDKKLDIDSELADELIMVFPMRFLCSEDCPGLCPKCGKKLSEGPCGCETHERDPRWDVLANYFDKNK